MKQYLLFLSYCSFADSNKNYCLVSIAYEIPRNQETCNNYNYNNFYRNLQMYSN